MRVCCFNFVCNYFFVAVVGFRCFIFCGVGVVCVFLVFNVVVSCVCVVIALRLFVCVVHVFSCCVGCVNMIFGACCGFPCSVVLCVLSSVLLFLA